MSAGIICYAAFADWLTWESCAGRDEVADGATKRSE